ncbi:hypothetical protein GCM10028819_49480 [Spirosoma humi]
MEDMVTEGDTIAARFLMRGTHQGTFMGIPPTSKPIQVQAMNFYRTDGQFIEEHSQSNMLGLLQLISAAPAA